jgi:hypothetical protein
VLDPESGLDAMRNLAVPRGKIQAVSALWLEGRAAIDAAGLAPWMASPPRSKCA